MPATIVALMSVVTLIVATMILAIFLGLGSALKLAACFVFFAALIGFRGWIINSLRKYLSVAWQVVQEQWKELAKVEAPNRSTAAPSHSPYTTVAAVSTISMLQTLMSCPACSGDVSTKAQACPHCGHPVQPPNATSQTLSQLKHNAATGAALIGIAVFFTLVIACGGLISSLPKSESTEYEEYYYRKSNLDREYRSRMNKLEDIYDEMMSDPYVTDQEFRDRLKRVEDVPVDF
jgi:hypothetical protein